MNSLTISPNSDDSQADDHNQKKQMRPTSAVSEALVSLVERAKNLKIDIGSQSLNLTRSCPTISRCQTVAAASVGGSITTISTSTNTISTKKPPIGRMLPAKSKARGFGPAATTGRGVAVPPATTTSTLRKVRKIDSQIGQIAGSTALPPPPPPSPRSPQSSELGLAVQLADALKDEYKRTEVLTNSIFQEAISINEELTQQWQHQRDLELVHQIEMATESHGLNLLLAENELTELKSRCLKTLDQVSVSQKIGPLSNRNQGTQTVDDHCLSNANNDDSKSSPLSDKDSQLGLAISQMQQLVSVGAEQNLTHVLTEAQNLQQSSILLELRDRLDEIRHLIGRVAEGICCEERLKEIRFKCQRNAAFYQVMESLETEIAQMVLLAPQLLKQAEK